MLLTSTDTTSTLAADAEQQVNKLKNIGDWFGNLGSNALTFLIKLAICIALYYVIYKVLNKILQLLDNYLDKRNVAPTVRHFATSLIRVSVLGLTIVTMIVQLDIVQASSIAAIIAAAGVGISLAVQGVLSNFAGGVLLLVLKPFKEGDYIIVKGENVEGTVLRIELYYTTIYTPDRCTLVIPNSTLTNKSVVNALHDNSKTLTIKVGVSYDTDLKKALGILNRLMEEEPRIQKGKGRTFVDEMADSSVVVGLKCFCDIKDYLDLNWDMREKIKLTFDQEGIEIPFNQLDVHIRNDEKENPPEKANPDEIPFY